MLSPVTFSDSMDCFFALAESDVYVFDFDEHFLAVLIYRSVFRENGLEGLIFFVLFFTLTTPPLPF